MGELFALEDAALGTLDAALCERVSRHAILKNPKVATNGTIGFSAIGIVGVCKH